MREYRYNNITQLNRNRLLWIDPTVDGVKTGFTETAGYCLVASAQRGERRLVSVVLGAQSESSRAQESQKLLNFGFQAFDGGAVCRRRSGEPSPCYKGTAAGVGAGFAERRVVTLPQGQAARLNAELLDAAALRGAACRGRKRG